MENVCRKSIFIETKLRSFSPALFGRIETKQNETQVFQVLWIGAVETMPQ